LASGSSTANLPPLISAADEGKASAADYGAAPFVYPRAIGSGRRRIRAASFPGAPDRASFAATARLHTAALRIDLPVDVVSDGFYDRPVR
jgi:hypothetical protein